MKKRSAKFIAMFLVMVLMTMSLTGCRAAYTPGTVDGSTYTNEWAEVKIDLPAGYKMLDPKDAGVSNGKYGEFDFACLFAADTNTKIPMCYIMTREGKVDIDEIGEEFTREFGGVSALGEVSQGRTTYQVSISKNYYSIAGASYTCFHMGVSVADIYCAFRDIEGTGLIAICVVTMSGGATEVDVYNMFEQLK
ncbi:MAG: hypothetical protein IKI15_06305 [Lachnospiraceae bacterium]|nr:hypothetical protein [Lachnospiraceae bacterium]